MTTLPFRARLRLPLPSSSLRGPFAGGLDTLTVLFRDRAEDPVTVVSAATDSSATYWCALGDCCMTYDGEDEAYPIELPIVPSEMRALAALGDLADEWDAAVKARDLGKLSALGRHIGSLRADVLTFKVAA